MLIGMLHGVWRLALGSEGSGGGPLVCVGSGGPQVRDGTHAACGELVESDDGDQQPAGPGRDGGQLALVDEPPDQVRATAERGRCLGDRQGDPLWCGVAAGERALDRLVDELGERLLDGHGATAR